VEPGREVSWGFRSDSGPIRVTARRFPEGSPEILRLSIASHASGGELTARYESAAAGRISAVFEGSSISERVVSRPALSRGALLSSQLSEWSGDPLFRAALETSRTMARALLQ
jgi:hypothetical protein